MASAIPEAEDPNNQYRILAALRKLSTEGIDQIIQASANPLIPEDAFFADYNRSQTDDIKRACLMAFGLTNGRVALRN
jgi:hypothetical protein